MALLIKSLLFASAVLAHTGIKRILIDGTSYHPFDSRIDHLVGPVNRIGWSFDVEGPVFNPITNFSDPALACRKNAQPPKLKAKARAGAEVSTFWTPITRMHNGPAVAYLGYLPTPNTSPNDIKFFKIYDQGFDASRDKWANQIASDNGDMFKFKIPSDIKPGTYILRAELIALHGNMEEIKVDALKNQIQIYPQCFSIEITGNGTATPEGVKFPGAYKANEPSFTFPPFLTYGNSTKGATEHNSKFVPPGPPRYNGKYEAPKGPWPVVKENGAYPARLEVKYQDLLNRIQRPTLKLANYINTAWPGYTTTEQLMKGYSEMGREAIAEAEKVKSSLKEEIEAFKKESH